MNMTPEHIHLAINHLPFLGSGLALIPILVGLIRRNKTTLVTGLAIATLCGWTTPLVMETGEQAYDRYEEGPVRPYLDADFEEWLEIHEHRAEDWAKVMYASAVAATLALLLIFFKPTAGRIASIVSAILCLASLGTGIWIAESAGAIRRPDFRESAVSRPTGDLPDKSSEHDGHHDSP